MATAEMQPIRSLELLLQQVLDSQKDTRDRVDELSRICHEGHRVVLALIARREVEEVVALGELNQEIGRQKQEFTDFKKVRDPNGTAGMCAEHTADIVKLKEKQAESVGRREILIGLVGALIVGILIAVIGGQVNNSLNQSRSVVNIPASKYVIQPKQSHPIPADTFGMIDSH